MITLNLTKEEIERLHRMWQHSWPHIDPDEEDTLGRKIQEAFIHRNDDIEPEHRYEVEECLDNQIISILDNRNWNGWELVSMVMTNDNQYILLFRK